MGKMPLYTMLQKARSAGGWTMVAQLEGDAAGSQLLLLEGRPVWQRGDSAVLLQHLTELQDCTAAGIHSVAGTDIFAERFDGFSCNDLTADCRLDRHFKQLARDIVFELFCDFSCSCICFVRVNDKRQCIDNIAVEQNVKLYKT